MSTRPEEAHSWTGRPLAETRWALEFARLLVDPVLRGDQVPHGDGRPVVLVPGFLAGDHTLLLMSGWLRRIGYEPHLCGFVGNVDCSDRGIERVERALLRTADEHGRRVALLGHSRGGHYVKALAHRYPELVSHAISMGSDLVGMLEVSDPTITAVNGVRATLKHIGRARSAHCLTPACECGFTRDYLAPFPARQVRLTSIYSKGDGVVRWQPQVVPYADCVEVEGSHVGLIFNRKSYRAIAKALSKPEL